MSLRLSGGRKLHSPPGSTARPTPARVRLAVMNMLAADLPGCCWLDLFSGSGVMGCEALQRGARAVLAIEQDRQMAATSRSNLELVAKGLQLPGDGAPRVQVLQQEVLRWLGQQQPSALSAPFGQPFDLIYADPPYAAGLYGAIAAAVTQGGWLQPHGLLVMECASNNQPDLSAQLQQGWQLWKEKRYGTSTVLMLSQS